MTATNEISIDRYEALAARQSQLSDRVLKTLTDLSLLKGYSPAHHEDLDVNTAIAIFNSIFFESPFPTFLKSDEHVVLCRNPMYEHVYGVTDADHLAKKDPAVWGEETATGFNMNDQHALDHGYAFVSEPLFNKRANRWEVANGCKFRWEFADGIRMSIGIIHSSTPYPKNRITGTE